MNLKDRMNEEAKNVKIIKKPQKEVKPDKTNKNEKK